MEALPSPFDPSPDEPLSHSLQDRLQTQVDYDWATFINAYALGRWDPLKTPQPPRSHLQAPSHPRTVSRTVEGLEICDSPEAATTASIWEHGLDDSAVSNESTSVPNTAPHTVLNSAPPQYHVPSSVSSASGRSALPVLPDTGIASRRATVPLNLGFHRLRNSFADMRSSSGASSTLPGVPESLRPHNISNTDVTTTAAAIRLAAARVSVAPLALPSPEHELTDPMRGYTTTIPGSHPSDFLQDTPPTTRKTRLSSFWQGTQDVDDYRLPTIEASPPESSDQSIASSDPRQQAVAPPFVHPQVVPATAPIKVSGEPEGDDYFGSLEPPRLSESRMSERTAPTVPISRPDHEPTRHLSAPPLDYEPATVPALPRRICLTRQTSAPLPTLALYERRLRSARPASESSILSQAGRSAKEEQMYSELGYLAPPNPPDELERRRALYKLAVSHTI